MYDTKELRSMQDVRDIFPNGVADKLNWIFLSTSGVHGSYDSIQDIEYILRGENPSISPLSNGKYFITVLIVHPRTCVLRWGELQVDLEDLNYLRKLVRSTLVAVNETQKENI